MYIFFFPGEFFFFFLLGFKHENKKKISRKKNIYSIYGIKKNKNPQMYLKNIYLYIYLYFFSFKNVSNQPTCFFRHDKQNSEKTFSLSFHSVSHMKERKFLRFVKNERFIIWVKNKARVPHNKTKIMFFLKPKLFFPGLVFMRKNLVNKMRSLNFTCDKNSSMCPKRMFSHWNLPALDFKREKSPEKHFPTLFITYQKTTLHINKDHQMC